MEIKPTSYQLENCATGRQFQDETGWMLADPQHKDPALVRAVYEKTQIEFKDNSYGIYKFADWMPIQRMLEGSCAPVTYKSEALAKELGLENLYITFSGWWPEKGAQMPTCSFKETEAYSVCARLPKENNRIMVVASAGNTARAFAQVCSKNNIPVVIAIPYDNLNALWFQEPLNDCVKIICSPAGTDYFDAIALAAKLNGSARYMEEGGAKNVARRDGMATTVLSAAQVIGRIPDSYFQAVGSGTGTIAQLMAPVARQVIGVEIVEEAVEAAKENAARNGLNNCTFLAGDVLKTLDEIEEKPDFIVLDPPRDGIHPKALSKIVNYGVENMVYISCKPTSLVRDLEVFLEAGYQVERACAVDQFPWTANCEVVCLLGRKN